MDDGYWSFSLVLPRFWGFVPEDHIVGRPVMVLVSFDGDKGGIRWNRILKKANPDK